MIRNFHSLKKATTKRVSKIGAKEVMSLNMNLNFLCTHWHSKGSRHIKRNVKSKRSYWRSCWRGNRKKKIGQCCHNMKDRYVVVTESSILIIKLQQNRNWQLQRWRILSITSTLSNINTSKTGPLICLNTSLNQPSHIHHNWKEALAK